MSKDRLSKSLDVIHDANLYGIKWNGNTPERVVGSAIIGVLAEFNSVPADNRVDLAYGSELPEQYFVGGVPGLPVRYFPHRDAITIGSDVISFPPIPELTPTARGQKLAEFVKEAIISRIGLKSSLPRQGRRV